MIKIKIIDIGLGLNQELTNDEGDMYGYKFFYLYRTLNQEHQMEGEAIRYETHDTQGNLPHNLPIQIRWKINLKSIIVTLKAWDYIMHVFI